MKLDFPKYYLTNFYLRYDRNIIIKNYIRAGIFPFFRNQEGQKHFILSVSSVGKNFSDFAGRRDRNDTCWKETAIRELYEESSGIFKFDKEMLDRSADIVYDGKCVYAFVELQQDEILESLVGSYKSNQDLIDNDDTVVEKPYHFKETCGLHIIHENDMKKLLQGELIDGMKLWGYLQLFFSSGKRWPVLKYTKSKHAIEKIDKCSGLIEFGKKEEIYAF